MKARTFHMKLTCSLHTVILFENRDIISNPIKRKDVNSYTLLTLIFSLHQTA